MLSEYHSDTWRKEQTIVIDFAKYVELEVESLEDFTAQEEDNNDYYTDSDSDCDMPDLI